MTLSEKLHSICPAGDQFPLPAEEDYFDEFNKIQKLVDAQRQKGREIVVVMGVGFVGSVMAGVIADSIEPDSGACGIRCVGGRAAAHRVACESVECGKRQGTQSPVLLSSGWRETNSNRRWYRLGYRLGRGGGT